MKKASLVAAIGTIFIAVGCSTLETKYDYDPRTDFSQYNTFAWARAPKEVIGSPQAKLLADNPLLDKRIKNGVTDQMVNKGFKLDDSRPDLLIVYHVGLANRVNVSNWGYRYGPYWGPGRVDVYGYREGTLIIDFVDAKKKELVWRGIAQKDLTEMSGSPEEREKDLNKIIERLLSPFPPKK